jgi:hypothetical protein
MPGVRFDLEDRLMRFGVEVCHVKELRETRAWLKLMGTMRLCPDRRLGPVMAECDELLAILVSSIRTARRNGP